MNLEIQQNLNRHILAVWTVSQALINFQSEIFFSFSLLASRRKK